MQLHGLALVATVLISVLIFAEVNAKPPNLDVDFSDYEQVRRRRQNHPDLTVAHIPELTVTTAVEGEPLPYLVPPPPPEEEVHQAASQAASQAVPQSWDLDYVAGEILVPPLPASHPGPYETMKFDFKNQPQEEDAPAASSSFRDFEPAPTNLYSFVKTDKEGHFKWGVRYHPV